MTKTKQANETIHKVFKTDNHIFRKKNLVIKDGLELNE